MLSQRPPEAAGHSRRVVAESAGGDNGLPPGSGFKDLIGKIPGHGFIGPQPASGAAAAVHLPDLHRHPHLLINAALAEKPGLPWILIPQRFPDALLPLIYADGLFVGMHIPALYDGESVKSFHTFPSILLQLLTTIFLIIAQMLLGEKAQFYCRERSTVLQ